MVNENGIHDYFWRHIEEGITLTRRTETMELTVEITDKDLKGPAANAMRKAARMLAECDFSDRAVMEDLASFIDSGCGILPLDWPAEFAPTCVCTDFSIKDGRLDFLALPRYYPTLSDEDALALVTRTLADRGFECEMERLNPGFWLEEDDVLVQAMVDEYRQFTGKDAKPTYGFGGTYSRAMKHSVSVGTMIGTRSPGLPEGHGGGHQPDEYLDIDAFLRACELITRMVLRENKLLEEGLV